MPWSEDARRSAAGRAARVTALGSTGLLADGLKLLQLDAGVEAGLRISPVVNYALQQNDVPFLDGIVLRNSGGQDHHSLRLRLTAEPAFLEPIDLALDRLAVGETRELRDVRPLLLRDVLSRQTEREAGHVSVEVLSGPQSLGTCRVPVDILAFNEWDATSQFPELTAAFVLPNDPFVAKVLLGASEVLATRGHGGGLSGYQKGDPEAVLHTLAAIYEALAAERIQYCVPPASFEKSGQKVRTPSQIAEGRLATCLDLAFLFAACCEQAGLNPLVVFEKGHAFAGGWILDDRLRAARTKDGSDLRKRYDLRQLVVVELTGLCQQPPVSFAAAAESARSRLNADSHFEWALDVRMARAAGIRPLPLHAASARADERLAGTPAVAPDSGDALPAGWRPPVAPDSLERPGLAPPAGAADRLTRWKAQLLDLTLRNRLLNFKEGKKTIPILCPDAGGLEDALAKGKPFKILPKPTVQGDTDTRDSATQRQRLGSDALVPFLIDAVGQKRLYSSLGDVDLQARLTEVYRAARLSLEEGGANTLFLALGFLRWYEADGSDKELKAPVLLIPVSLDRANVREGFTLRQIDEDARINVTLIKRLEEFGISLPGLDPLPEDENGYNVPLILDQIRNAVRERPRWDVRADAALCILTFTKFLMWVDLEKNAEALRRSEVVRHLIDTPNEPFVQGEFPRETDLDTTHRPADVLCPVDADASQLAAVAASAAGRSFVLQGPPGTGKSQTITNLISNELAQGRRVLFVAQKSEALKVVHDRLARSGLGPFCLEAHSTKVSKDSLRQQLREAVEASVPSGGDDWLTKARSLEGLRQDLNGYAEALHRPHPCGLTAFEAYATLIGNREIGAVHFELGDLAALDRDRLETMRSAVRQMGALALEVRPSATHPLRAVRRRRWSEALERDTARECDVARIAVHRLSEKAGPVLERLGLAAETVSRSQLDFAVGMAELLAEGRFPPERLLTEPNWRDLSQRLAHLISRGERRDASTQALLGKWSPGFLDADHGTLLRELAEARASGFLKRGLRLWALAGRLSGFRRDGRRPNLQEAETDLRAAEKVRSETATLADPACEGAVFLGAPWAAGAGDWKALTGLLDWATRYRALLESAPEGNAGSLDGQRELWLRLATTENETRQYLRRALPELKDANERTRRGLDSLEGVLELDREIAWGADDAPGHLSDVSARIEGFLASLRDLPDWCAYREQGAALASLGLGPLCAALDTGAVSPGQVLPAFERGFAAWLVDVCRRVEPNLEKFSSGVHQARIEEFRRTDTDLRDLTPRVVQARLTARLPRVNLVENGPRSSETGKLSRFIQGGRGAIRKLFLECPGVLKLYKPCFLMSPLSVAQFLDKDFPPFDVVVFDEASQMPVWEAIGAIARGQRLIVVGDSKQLPPTSFFERMASEETLDEDVVADEESILDECRGAQLPALTLKWHYRSRHEGLIAFSNRQYYENSLLTFPSAGLIRPGLGVHWREVPGGVYDGGQSRTNRKEAEALVADIVRRLRDPQERHRSIGVVTFSVAQQTLVENLLDERRRTNPEIDFAFTRDRDPIFVKNLETVQGDERDVILFSICYGPDSEGRVQLRFGPLNMKGGERRLNVAVTRAREELVVFSTLRPEQIDLSRTGAIGVAHLKAFLDYAHRGPAALADPATAPGAVCESPFEQAVYDSLSLRGWSLHKQVGCSGYRIDLAVVHPEDRGRYILGIECDGANYHSSKAARDRDRLRASVLQGLGWQLHRIWSSDWWRDPQREIEKAERAIRSALGACTSSPHPVAPAGLHGNPNASQRPPESAPALPALPHLGTTPGARETRPYATGWAGPNTPTPAVTAAPVSRRERPWVPWSSTKVHGDKVQFYEGRASGRIRETVVEIVRAEGPVEFSRLVRLVGTCWGLQRATDRARQHVRLHVPADTVSIRTHGGREFAWLSAQDPAAWDIYRVPPDGQSRDADEICPEEAAAAAAEVLDAHISLDETELLQQVARLFGIQRVGDNIRQVLLEGLRLLEQSARLTYRGDVLERAELTKKTTSTADFGTSGREDLPPRHG